MALSGTIEDIGFAELLQLLNVGHKSGRLNVWRGTERAEIFITKGEIARAVSHRERGPEVIYRILGWRAGEFMFERNDNPVMREITESTEALILEGMKRFDEWEHVESELPNWQVVLRQRAFQVNEHYDSLSAEARMVLRLVDAKRNIATIIRESGLPPAQASIGITELLNGGIVEEWQAPSQLSDVVVTGGQLPKSEGLLKIEPCATGARRK